jgi:hypothetical protein
MSSFLKLKADILTWVKPDITTLLLHLAVCDYETGGVWCYIYANSVEEIQNKYSGFIIYTEEPTWFSNLNRMIAKKIIFDIDEKPTGIIKDLIDACQSLRE